MLRNRMRKSFLYCALLATVVLSLAPLPLSAQDFKAPAPEELSMKDNPAAPGAHAMILEWIIDANDMTSTSLEYYRIKVFTEQGKSHGDIEIPYNHSFSITDIKARTIQPDGTIIPFNGKVFEKVVVKGKGYEVRAKTFTFPDVRPGSILEYRFRINWDQRALLNTTWKLQKKLYISKAKLSLKPYLRGTHYATYISMLAPGTKQPVTTKEAFVLTLENVPAFEDEDFSLPEAQIVPHIDFFYRNENAKNADEYWTNAGKTLHDAAEDFIGRRNGIRNAVSQIVAPTDDDETKLRKIYARVQQVRNLSYESTKTAKEQERVTPKDNNNVEDVLKNGYGYRSDITRLFVALARAAGLEAGIVRISQRDSQIFQRAMFDVRQLDSEIAVATAQGKDVLLDPATPFCPYGLLAWENTGVEALRLDKNGGTFFRTPQPLSTESITRRSAELRMDEDGNLSGRIIVMYEGQEALSKRLSALETDDVEQRKDYEERVEGWLPGGSKAKLLKIDSATDPSKPLHLEFEVTIPSVTSSVGSRTLLPMLVFQAGSRNPFEFTKRLRPVYFRYPFQEIDGVRITLPDGTKVESLPKGAVLQQAFGFYDTKWQNGGNAITVLRRRAIGGFVFPHTDYPALRDFYSQVNSSDRESVVLRMGQ
jgi:hypothetical protein